MRVLGIDLETRSRAEIKDLGTAPYARHASTDVILGSLMLVDIEKGRDGYVWSVVKEQEWYAGDELDADLRKFIESGGPVVAHNAAFEHEMIQHVLVPRYGWPEVSPEQWIDTMEEANRFSLPATLDGLCGQLKTLVQKDDEGKKLMLRLCKPDKKGKIPTPTADELSRLMRYCRDDVRSMLWGLCKMVPFMLRDRKLDIDVLRVHRRVNDRGVRLDLELANAIAETVERRANELNDEVPGEAGDFFKLTELSEIRKWFADAHGLEVKSLDQAHINAMLKGGNLCPEARRLLELRLEHGKAGSLAKSRAATLKVAPDTGRVHYAFIYYAAHTGRWSSRGVQLHNMPKVKKAYRDKLDDLREAVLARDYERVKELAPNVLEGCSQLQRSQLVADPGCMLIGADFSAIEARVLAWLANSPATLAAFREDRDIYVEDAAAIGSDNRQLGKVCRLALGYGMGAVKFADTARKSDVPLTYGKAREVATAWRKANPEIPTFALGLQVAFRALLRGERVLDAAEALLDTHPVASSASSIYKLVQPVGEGRVRVGEHTEVFTGRGFIAIQLPSGRCIRYWGARYETGVKKKVRVVDPDDPTRAVTREMETDNIVFGRSKGGPRMVPDSTYSGRLAENVTQAVARDLLGHSMVQVEKHGWPVVMHVHDSLVCEVAESDLPELSTFERVVASCPEWAAGLPLAAEGYISERFQG